MNEYDVKTPYGTYQTKGEDDPYSILMKMASWNKEIRSTISDVQQDVDGTIERQSQILQSVEAIELNVAEVITKADGVTARVGSLEVTSSAITLSVTAIDSRVGAAEGKIVTMAGQIDLKASSATVTSLGSRVTTAEVSINGLTGSISSKVSHTDYNGVTIASLINQSAHSISINAQAINLVGAVTVLSNITGNLGNITAGTIRGATFILDGGRLDLSLGSIFWGDNVPADALYARNAGNANMLNGSYTASSFSLNGHTHSNSDYVKPYTGQSLQLWLNGSKLRVYQGGSYTEFTGV